MKVPKIELRPRGKSGMFWVRYSFNGEREHYSLETTDEVEAKKEVRRIVNEIELGIHRPRRKVIFDNLWERYKQEEWPEKRPTSRERDKTSIKFLLVVFGGKAIIEETFRDEVREYRRKRLEGKLRIDGLSKKDKVSKATVNREIALLKRIINLAVYEWQLLRTNPLQNFSMLNEEKRERYITAEEWQRLLSASSPELRDFLIVARFTGIRYGLRSHGILGLKWTDIDLDNWEIKLRDSKNREGRIVYMNETVHKVLKRRKARATSEWVFPGRKGKRRCSFDTVFKLAKRRACINDLRIHDIRHAFGTDKKSQGVDLPSLAKLMGHKDIKTTMRYGEPDEDHLRRIMGSKPRSHRKSGPNVDQIDGPK
jgi:integrase